MICARCGWPVPPPAASPPLCPPCACARWLRQTEPLGALIARQGPERLLSYAAQQEVGRVYRQSGATRDLGALDWLALVGQWALPFPDGVSS